MGLALSFGALQCPRALEAGLAGVVDGQAMEADQWAVRQDNGDGGAADRAVEDNQWTGSAAAARDTGVRKGGVETVGWAVWTQLATGAAVRGGGGGGREEEDAMGGKRCASVAQLKVVLLSLSLSALFIHKIA